LDNDIGANARGSTIAGGRFNDIGANAPYSAIGGGTTNNIGSDSEASTIAGGNGNDIGANSTYSVIGGGLNNSITANASYATIPGGRNNSATNYAFAAGRRARANHQGAFVWADSVNAEVASTNNNSMTFRASGGVRVFSNAGASAGVFLATGDTSWSSISDRKVKKNFADVNSLEVLEKLAALPVQHWNYRWEPDDAVPHLGPMAQDFKGAFYPGRDDTSITTQELDGVALAAIQGLNRKVEQQRAELEQKQTELTGLKQRLEKLERLMDEKNGGAH
jgi:hypothetical protein